MTDFALWSLRRLTKEGGKGERESERERGLEGGREGERERGGRR